MTTEPAAASPDALSRRMTTARPLGGRAPEMIKTLLTERPSGKFAPGRPQQVHPGQAVRQGLRKSLIG
ncbi:hypothetical protein GCM10027456_21330 [Kineosporia babensis]